MTRKLIILVLLLISINFLSGYDTGKSPLKAMALSAFLPGGGQIYNQAYYKGAGVIAVQGFFMGSLIYHNHQVNKYEDKALDAAGEDFFRYQRKYNDYFDKRQNSIWWFGSILFLSILDAYVDANLYNYEQEKGGVEILFDQRRIGISYRW